GQPATGNFICGQTKAVDYEQCYVARKRELFLVFDLKQLARTLNSEWPEGGFAFKGTFSTAKIRHRLVENILGVFGAAAAGRSVKCVDWFAIVGCYDSSCFIDGARRQARLARQTAINLRARRRQQIESFRSELSAIPDGVGARGDGLCFQS